jgi:hypothetical protein
VTSSLLAPHTFLSTLFPNTLSQRERPSFTPIQITGQITFAIHIK